MVERERERDCKENLKGKIQQYNKYLRHRHEG